MDISLQYVGPISPEVLEQRLQLIRAHREGRLSSQRYHNISFAAIPGEIMQPWQAVSNGAQFAWMSKPGHQLPALFLTNPSNGVTACWRLPQGRLILTKTMLLVITGKEIWSLELNHLKIRTSQNRPPTDFTYTPHKLKKITAAAAYQQELVVLHQEPELVITQRRSSFRVEPPTTICTYTLLVEEDKIWIFGLGFTNQHHLHTRCYTKTGDLLAKLDLTYSFLEDRGWQDIYPNKMTSIQPTGERNLYQIITTSKVGTHSIFIKTNPFQFCRAIKGTACYWRGKDYIADGDEIRIDHLGNTIARISRDVRVYEDNPKLMLVSDSYVARIAFPGCWPECWSFSFVKDGRSGGIPLNRGLYFGWEKVSGCHNQPGMYRGVINISGYQLDNPAPSHKAIMIPDDAETLETPSHKVATAIMIAEDGTGRLDIPNTSKEAAVVMVADDRTERGENPSEAEHVNGSQPLDLEEEPWEDPDQIQYDDSVMIM